MFVYRTQVNRYPITTHNEKRERLQQSTLWMNFQFEQKKIICSSFYIFVSPQVCLIEPRIFIGLLFVGMLEYKKVNFRYFSRKIFYKNGLQCRERLYLIYFINSLYLQPFRRQSKTIWFEKLSTQWAIQNDCFIRENNILLLHIQVNIMILWWISFRRNAFQRNKFSYAFYWMGFATLYYTTYVYLRMLCMQHTNGSNKRFTNNSDNYRN